MAAAAAAVVAYVVVVVLVAMELERHVQMETVGRKYMEHGEYTNADVCGCAQGFYLHVPCVEPHRWRESKSW